ncbi:MAG: PspA-associated protein PspAA [Candidatus Nitrosocaldus sp.]
MARRGRGSSKDSKDKRRESRITKGKRKEDKKIVRLMGEGQYYVDEGTLKEINAIDNRMVRLLESNASIDEQIIRESIAGMRMLVKSKGKRVSDDTIIPSHIIIPSIDITLEEAREIFKGEGLVPEEILD